METPSFFSGRIQLDRTLDSIGFLNFEGDYYLLGLSSSEGSTVRPGLGSSLPSYNNNKREIKFPKSKLSQFVALLTYMSQTSRPKAMRLPIASPLLHMTSSGGGTMSAASSESVDSSTPDFSYVPELWEQTIINLFGYNQQSKFGHSLRLWIKTQSFSDLWGFTRWTSSDFDINELSYRNSVTNEFIK